MTRASLRLLPRLLDSREQGTGGAGGDLLERWAAYLSACGSSPSTVTLRLNSIRALLRFVGVTDPLALTRDDVVAWLGRPVKQWTRVTYWSSVHALSAWLAEFDHDRGSDLTRGISRPSTPAPVARPISDAMVERLLALHVSPRAHAYIRLALYQALRVHEIAKLRADDFDLAAGWLLVTGKGGSTKPIPVHPEIARLAETMPAFGWWFPSASASGHVTANGVSVTITNALKACGSSATAHQLRDTAATRMQRTVKDIRITQSMLRHANITSTQKYTEASNEELRRAVHALDWSDAAQRPAAPAANPQMAADLSTEQLHALVAALTAELGRRR